ncbi:site-2 protease family protein [Bacillaceae bacterium CLA-AA-H227]|uniref:Site-2 protease family protein n=1 Tax=Robertmurraya yapensis (ex Hitch et al 2024) TaxID=3133160 RepID=A0ACC6SDW4_9BACI
MDSIEQIALTLLILVSIIFPLTTFVHELGHALLSLFLFKEPVEIRLGKPTTKSGFKIGKLTIKVQPISGWVGYTDFKIPKDMNNSIQHASVLLFGPIFSFMLSLVCYILVAYLNLGSIPTFLIKLITQAAFVQFIITLLPIKYPSFFGSYKGMASDGYQLMQLIMRRANS